MNEANPESRASGFAFFVLALVLYLPTLFWGLPAATAEGRTFTPATDEILPLGPLAEMHNTFVESKPDRNYAYPWLGYFVAAAAQAPYLGWQFVTGNFSAPSPAYPYGFADPVAGLRGLTLAGRLVSLLMAAGVVAASAAFARELFGARVGLVAGALTLTNFSLAYYSGTGNLDAPGAFWVALGLVVFARILRRGMAPRRLAWLGVWAGLAMATKDQALVVFLPMAVALAWPGFAGAMGSYPRKALLTGLAAATATYALGVGMLFDPARHIEHVRRLFFASEMLTAGDLYWPPAGRDMAGRLGLTRAYFVMWGDVLSWPGLVASCGGVLLAWKRSRRTLVVALPLIVLFFLLAWPMGHAIRRYGLPLAMPLDAMAAIGLCAITRVGLRRTLIVLVVGWKLLIVCDLSVAQLNESRARMGERIAELRESDADDASGSDRLEYFGHAQQLPPLPAWMESRRIAGRETWEGEFDHGPSVLAYLREHGPGFVIIAPDWTSKPEMERSEDCPPVVWRALLDGSAGYVCVAHFGLHGGGRFLPVWSRPRLDSRSVSPPIRLFARADVAEKRGLTPCPVDSE